MLREQKKIYTKSHMGKLREKKDTYFEEHQTDLSETLRQGMTRKRECEELI